MQNESDAEFAHSHLLGGSLIPETAGSETSKITAGRMIVRGNWVSLVNKKGSVVFGPCYKHCRTSLARSVTGPRVPDIVNQEDCLWVAVSPRTENVIEREHTRRRRISSLVVVVIESVL